MNKILLSAIFILSALVAQPTAINVVAVKKGTLQQEESFVGSVIFKEVAHIAVQSSGVIKEISFRAGQKVKKGEKLLSLNDEFLQKDIVIKQARMRQAGFVLEKKQKELQRYKNLLKTQSVPLQEYENIQYEVKSQEANIMALRAELDISRLDLKHKVVYAPFDGIIVERKVHLGEWVQTGEVVAQILNTKDVEVIADVPSFVMAHLAIHQKVSVKINNRSYEGSVVAMIPKSDVNSRNFPIYISIQGDEGLLDGMPASIKLGINAQNIGFLIPRDCIIQRRGKSGVFVLRGQRVEFVGVEILSINRGNALVQGALKEGESLVLRGQDRLENGAEVKIVQ